MLNDNNCLRLWKFLLLLFVVLINDIHAKTIHEAAAAETNNSSICGRNSAISIRKDLAIALCRDNIVRIVRTSTNDDVSNATRLMMQRESLVIDPTSSSSSSSPFTDFEIIRNQDNHVISIITNAVRIEVEYNDNDDDDDKPLIYFFDSNRNYLFTHEVETTAENYDDDNENRTQQQSWYAFVNESLYGGGQFVNGFLDYKAAPVHLVHTNLEIAVPFFVSSRGYGILWDLYGETWLNPPNRKNKITLSNNRNTIDDDDDSLHHHVATGIFTPPESGHYWFAVDMQAEPGYWNSNKQIRLELYDTTFTEYVAEKTKTTACDIHEENIPKIVTCQAKHLRKDTDYKVSLTYDSNATIPLVYVTHKDGTNRTTLQTKDSDFIDYYMIFTTNTTSEHSHNKDNEEIILERNKKKEHQSSLTIFDSIIASYRQFLTGDAALFSKKSYGFWQCREHYGSQGEILEAAAKFRSLQIPVDNIVQDWHYWGDLGWGPQWDPSLYPHPPQMIAQLQDEYDLNFMVSVWSKFDEKTKFYKEMSANHFLIDDSNWFDPWNPKARDLFYQYLDRALFSIGADAVWLDATEPELDVHVNKTVYSGKGNDYRNTYALQVNKAFYQGILQKQSSYQKRPFALSRSSFAGQHRYNSVVWSGDTLASFECLKRQIAMSLNYQLSGDPYWTMDIGGFYRPQEQYTSPDYQLLLVRWFQFGVFVPIFRVHGCGSRTELWNYGNETQNLIVESAIQLRYRLLPYIYSGFQRVATEGYTMQRAMVFDFLEDPNVKSLADQFLFGDSFLVAPIYNAKSQRTLYLPPLGGGGGCCCNSSAAAVWRDFYSGQIIPPGQKLARKVDLNRNLLFVRSSIVVLAPKSQQHAHDDDKEELEVRIYAGTDSQFTLYEDDGIDPDPLRPFVKIIFSWSEQDSQLTIHKLLLIQEEGREEAHHHHYYSGGMPPSLQRTLHIVLVRPNHGVGVEETQEADATVTYDYGQNEKLIVNLKKIHNKEITTTATNGIILLAEKR